MSAEEELGRPRSPYAYRPMPIALCHVRYCPWRCPAMVLTMSGTDLGDAAPEVLEDGMHGDR
eukprot:972334-Rhodomonas_salina.1